MIIKLQIMRAYAFDWRNHLSSLSAVIGTRFNLLSSEFSGVGSLGIIMPEGILSVDGGPNAVNYQIEALKL
ncbi:hypothetical protein TNCT_99001 [Trichonephila clavata]|uniref:Uncharacterized protein n=1 Tax=Trichonephila clavata TaxID=2740835 RepID=A0A8X6KRB0_TRICU|nr:hypothetical protein TNCT_99001 [Trichonephila clavata]